MDFGLIDSKLSDANYCLHEMYKQERRASDPMNVFPRNHDAFFYICATALGLFDGRGDGERDAAIKAWKSDWERHQLTPERKLYQLCQGECESDDRLRVQILGVQDDRTLTKKRYVYNIDGVQRDVTAVAEAYFKLLSRMVADAKQANL